ncbi:MAG: hypothetical protein ACI9KE_004658 [Polyangiales bacterium]|jgi:hypothetical protein
MVIHRYTSTAIDVVQTTLWGLMLWFPDYVWPAAGILVSFATLFLFRNSTSTAFRRPLLLLGAAIFNALIFLVPILYTKSPFLLGLSCLALGVLLGERLSLYLATVDPPRASRN